MEEDLHTVRAVLLISLLIVVTAIELRTSRERLRRRRRRRRQHQPEGGLVPRNAPLDIPQLLHPGNGRYLYWYTRMRHESFYKLLSWLEEHGLSNGQNKSHLLAEEKLLVFLHITGSPSSYRTAAVVHRRSLATISRLFHEVLNLLVRLHADVVPPRVVEGSSYDRRARRVLADQRFVLFEGCLGAIDGTHVPAHVVGEPAPWRNRKGVLSQNILAACNLEGDFTYVYPGWEGSAHDGRIVRAARAKGGLNVAEGSYYLGDAGYSNKSWLMVPFRGTRYHLREFQATTQSPQNYRELFNYRHSSMRTAIERAFGVLKRRFQILKHAPEFSIKTQVKLIYALTAVNNFLNREHDEPLDPSDDEDSESEDENVALGGTANINFSASGREDDSGMNQRREDLAQALWERYQQGLDR